MNASFERVNCLLKEFTEKLREGNNEARLVADAHQSHVLRSVGDGMPRLTNAVMDIEAYLREWKKRRDTHADLAHAASALLDNGANLNIEEKIELKLRLDEYENELVTREEICSLLAKKSKRGFRRIFN